LTFAIATNLHGSGFLAVFIAGLFAGRERLQAHDSTEGFLAVLAALSEMVMFTALGLTVVASTLTGDLLHGLVIFALLTFLIRPLVCAAALIPESLTRQERIFVAWGGLKGAVPILLASFPALAGAPHASAIYNIVFVAVIASVLVQGTTLPILARRFGLLSDS
jgi:cell volume regulation protein A